MREILKFSILFAADKTLIQRLLYMLLLAFNPFSLQYKQRGKITNFFPLKKYIHFFYENTFEQLLVNIF